MDKHELASALRRRQLIAEIAEYRYLMAVSDDEIIASYTTCSGCGKPTMSDVDLRLAIVTASDVDEFLRFTASDHHH